MDISSKPNLLFEALAYFERRANGSTLRSIRAEMISSGDTAKLAHANIMRPLAELEAKLDEALDYPKDQISFFFESFDGSQGGVTGDNRAMLLFKYFICRDLRVDQLISFMLSMTDVEFARAVIFGMSGKGEVTLGKECEELSDYFEIINGSSRTDEVKWYICDALMLRKKYLKTLLPMLTAAVNAIRENASFYMPLVERFTNNYTHNPDLADDITEKLGSRWRNLSGSQVRLIPLCFAPVGYFIFGNTNDDDMIMDATVFIGVLSDNYFSGEAGTQVYSDILPVLAVLCDKTRFLLLQRIAAEPAYGQQLADEFGMTTPNIYHHMGKLIQAKLASTKIDRNRNYYSINKNSIKQVLKELSEVLLLDT